MGNLITSTREELVDIGGKYWIERNRFLQETRELKLLLKASELENSRLRIINRKLIKAIKLLDTSIPPAPKGEAGILEGVL